MIPPISPTTVTTNPQFAALHKKLTTEIIDPEASTRRLNNGYLSTEEELHKQHVQQAKDDILRRLLEETVSSDALPTEVRELVHIVSDYMSKAPELELSETETESLTHTITKFTNDLSKITPALHSALLTRHDTLTKLTQLLACPRGHISSAALPKARFIPGAFALSTNLQTLLASLTTHHQSKLPTLTTSLLATFNHLLSLLTSHLTTLITRLERYTHGTNARHKLAHSAHLSTLSTTLASKTQILALDARKATYTLETQKALSNYIQHLETWLRSLEAGIQTCEEELELYRECDGQGGRAIGEVARRYRDVLVEIKEVKVDIERLEKDKMRRKGV